MREEKTKMEGDEVERNWIGAKTEPDQKPREKVLHRLRSQNKRSDRLIGFFFFLLFYFKYENWGLELFAEPGATLQSRRSHMLLCWLTVYYSLKSKSREKSVRVD